MSLGLDGGELGCTGACTFDTSECFWCGDGAVNGTEECDTNDLNGETCQDLGFYGGNLLCSSGCTFDNSACERCGDAIINGNEECDGVQLGGESCESIGYNGGALSCKSDCTIDTTACQCNHPPVIQSCSNGWCSIPKGCFSMGSPATELCRSYGETEHYVTLTHDFEIGATEVTQDMFRAAMGYNPAAFTACGGGCPVEQISWSEAAAYANALSANKGLDPCYTCTGTGPGVVCSAASKYASSIYACPGYRLPTDAEWEYSYRAGTSTALYNGQIADCMNDPNANLIAWNEANSNGTTHPVGIKLANAWGLHDVAGNVFEWTHDWKIDDLGAAPAKDPWGPAAQIPGVGSTLRGGSYLRESAVMRAADRDYDENHDFKANWIGFRLARSK